MDPTAERAASLRAYPNIRSAAKILGIAASTLSRRADLATEGRGDRDRVLAPTEVLRLAAIYRKRSLNDIAQDLIDLARESPDQEAMRVEGEIESFFEGRLISTEQREQFLDSARRLLPPALLAKVEEAVAGADSSLPEALLGHPPLPED